MIVVGATVLYGIYQYVQQNPALVEAAPWTDLFEYESRFSYRFGQDFSVIMRIGIRFLYV